jgi:Mitochondrial ribosomal protein (VAR1)
MLKLSKQKTNTLNILLTLTNETRTALIFNNTSLAIQANQDDVYKLSNDSYNKQTIGTLKHCPPAIKEWNNSIYAYNPNNSLKILPAIDKSVYNLLEAYFNLNPSLAGLGMSNTKHSMSKRFKRFSMIKLFIGKPEIKHINNKVIITVYTYNRKKIYFLNKIKKIFNINGHSVNANRAKFSCNKSKSLLNNSLITRPSNKLPLIKNKKLDFLCRLKTPKHSTLSRITSFNINRLQNNQNKSLTKPQVQDPNWLANPLQKRFIHSNNGLKIKKNVSPPTANTFKLLKIRLQKRKKVLFNVIKNKPISFFFLYIASQLVKTSTSCPTTKKLAKTTYAALANSLTETQINLGMPYLIGKVVSHTNVQHRLNLSELRSLNFIFSKIVFSKSKRATYTSFVKKNTILKNKILQIQPILSNLSSITTLMELKKNPLTQTWIAYAKSAKFNALTGLNNSCLLNKYKKMSFLMPATDLKLYKIKILSSLAQVNHINTMTVKKFKIFLFKKHKGKYSTILQQNYNLNCFNSSCIATLAELKKKLYTTYKQQLFGLNKNKHLLFANKPQKLNTNHLNKLVSSSIKTITLQLYKDIIQIDFYQKHKNKYKNLTKDQYKSLVKIFLTKDQSKFLLYKDLNLLPTNPSRFKKGFLYKYYCSMLYFNGYIFNANNLLPLKEILKKIYHKKVELNIINLKYLYLDSNIFAEAITKKLKDRQKRVLRVLKLGLKLTKKPYFKRHFHKDNIQLNFMFCDKKVDLNINSNSVRSIASPLNNVTTTVVGHSIPKNKYLIFKPNGHKIRLFLYHMKQKIVSGIRLQGTGRLTKRLTASRSISKVKYMGSLKNINSSYENISTVMLRGFVKSNLQYININNYNRNGSFGIKVSVSVY